MAARVKKNKYQQIINAALDLHGLTALEAEAALANFLADARSFGYERVRIITGKGVNSPDGRAVLKPLVETWLKDHGYNWRSAKISEGGEGALDIDL